MGARFLSSTGLGYGALLERAQFFPVPALDKNRSPIFPSFMDKIGQEKPAFFCLSFPSLPLLFDILKPNNCPPDEVFGYYLRHHQPTKFLFLQYLQLVPAKFLVNRAFPICQLHFTLFFLRISRKPKMPNNT